MFKIASPLIKIFDSPKEFHEIHHYNENLEEIYEETSHKSYYANIENPSAYSNSNNNNNSNNNTITTVEYENHHSRLESNLNSPILLLSRSNSLSVPNSHPNVAADSNESTHIPIPTLPTGLISSNSTNLLSSRTKKRNAPNFEFLTRFEHPENKEQYIKYLFSVIDNAENAFVTMNYDKAAQEYDKAIESILRYWKHTSTVDIIMEQLPALYLYCMESHFENDNITKAVKLGYEYVREYPNDINAYQALSFCLRSDSQYNEAIKVCNHAMAKFPNENTLYSIRGKSYYDKGEYKYALKDFHRSVELSRLKCGEPALKGKVLKIWLRQTVF